MNELWGLIQAKAEAIAGYYKFLESDYAKTAEAEPLVATVHRIIGEDRDHLCALKYLYDTVTKDKAATTMIDFALAEYKAYQEKNKLIK